MIVAPLQLADFPISNVVHDMTTTVGAGLTIVHQRDGCGRKKLRKAKYYVISAKYAGFHTNFSGKPHDLPRNMRLYSNHDRKAAITEPLLLFSLKPSRLVRLVHHEATPL